MKVEGGSHYLRAVDDGARTVSTFYNFLQTVWWQSTDATLLIMTSFKRKRFGYSQGSIVSILMGIMMPSSFSPPSSLFFIHVFNQITD